MSLSIYTHFIGGYLASIINSITTDSLLPSPIYQDINITNEFPYVREGGKPSSKLYKQVNIVCLTSQDIQ